MISWDLLKPEEAKKLHLDNNALSVHAGLPAGARLPWIADRQLPPLIHESRAASIPVVPALSLEPGSRTPTFIKMFLFPFPN